MLIYILKWIILYTILIFFLHNIYLFFEKNLTVTKTKDFYNFPVNEYNKISNILNSTYNTNTNHNTNANTNTNANDNANTNANDNLFQPISNYDNKDYLMPININNDEDNKFDISKFNSQFENKKNNETINMKNELEEFLTKLNN